MVCSGPTGNVPRQNVSVAKQLVQSPLQAADTDPFDLDSEHSRDLSCTNWALCL